MWLALINIKYFIITIIKIEQKNIWHFNWIINSIIIEPMSTISWYLALIYSIALIYKIVNLKD